jgi:cytoskeletal protein RodZ
LSQEAVANRLGLATADIKNIEGGCFELLPATTSAKDATRHYALLLGENPADFDQPASNHKINLEPSTKPLVAVSKTTSSLLALLIMFAVGGFLIWRIVAALALPELNIHQPNQGLNTTKPTITVSGNSSEQAQVFVNDTDVPLNPDGSFATEVILSPGPNEIKVVAINSFGRQNQQNRTVIYQIQNP